MIEYIVVHNVKRFVLCVRSMSVRVRDAGLVRALVVRVWRDVTDGSVSGRGVEPAAHRGAPAPRAAPLQPRARLRAVVPVRVAVARYVRTPAVRDGHAFPARRQAQAGNGGAAPVLLRAPQGIRQEKGR